MVAVATERVNLIEMRINGQWYVFRYANGREIEITQAIGRFAADPSMPDFTWWEAADVIQAVRMKCIRRQKWTEWFCAKKSEWLDGRSTRRNHR